MVHGPCGTRTVLLRHSRLTVGRHGRNDLVLETDHAVSRLHAVFERTGPAWMVTELKATNGTFVNGSLLVGTRALRSGDVVRIGGTELQYVEHDDEPLSATSSPGRAPELTRREREVLTRLCEPFLRREPFAQAVPVRTLAERLFVTEDAVKQHLQRLYAKFELWDPGRDRRHRLASEAILRLAVTPADLALIDRRREATMSPPTGRSGD